MHHFSPFVRSIRFNFVIALYSVALLGCGNAPAGARQTTQQTVDSAPPRWTPRPIQVARPVVADTGVKDSTAADSAGIG